MCLLNPEIRAIANARDEVIRQLMDTQSPQYHQRVEHAQTTMNTLMIANYGRKLAAAAVVAARQRDESELTAWLCPDCNGRGWIVREYPVFADGGYSDIEQIATRCACNPEPDDVELFIAENDLPLIDFDPAVCDARYEGI